MSLVGALGLRAGAVTHLLVAQVQAVSIRIAGALSAMPLSVQVEGAARDQGLVITLPETSSTVALAGDWHGKLRWALDRIDDMLAAGARTIVHLGDFGYWVPDPATRKYMLRTEKRLAELDLLLLCVDGNHEDRDRLNALPLDHANGLRPVSGHVAHLPRGHRRTWRDDDGLP